MQEQYIRSMANIFVTVVISENLNLNSLLVKRQKDNSLPGAVTGGHKRSDFIHAIIRHFSRGNQRIREVIPVPKSLREETTFIGVCTSRGRLTPATPYLWNKVICKHHGFTFQTFL